MSVNYTSAAYEASNPGKTSEMMSSPIERWSTSRFQVTVILRTEWALRYALANDIFGGRLVYPRLTAPVCLPESVQITPPDNSKTTQSGSLQGAVYDYAEVQIEYSSLENTGQDPEDPEQPGTGAVFFSEEWEDGVEMVPLSYKRFQWKTPPNTNLTPEEAPSRQVAVGVMTQTLHNLKKTVTTTDTRIAAARALVGKVNADIYESKIYGFKALDGTLLCSGSRPSLTVNSTGELRINISTTFQYRADGWNKFWRQDLDGGQGGFDTIGGLGGLGDVVMYDEVPFKTGMIGTFTTPPP